MAKKKTKKKAKKPIGPYCPECGEYLERLLVKRHVIDWQTEFINADGETEWEDSGSGNIDEWAEYTCPECDALISEDESDAIDFLNEGAEDEEEEPEEEEE